MFRIKLIISLIHLNENIVFYPRLKRFYKSQLSKVDPVIVDVGSNKGQTIDFFLKHFKDAVIYGFEPNAELFAMLCEKYKGNKNVKLFNLGVSDQSGKLLFNETVTSETSTFEELNYDSEYLKTKSKVLGVSPENIIKKRYEVAVTTLADFIEEQKISNIDVLKIDTEGHEYKCLVGLFRNNRSKITYIQLEHHNDDMYKNKVGDETMEKLLNNNSFRLDRVIKHGFGNLDEVIYKRG